MANNKTEELTEKKPIHAPKEKTTEWEGMGITGSAQQAEEFVAEYDQDDEIPQPGADGLTPTSSPGGSLRKKKDH